MSAKQSEESKKIIAEMKEKGYVDQADLLAAALKDAAGLRANVWRNHVTRVYINGHGKDIKAFFAWDEEDGERPLPIDECYYENLADPQDKWIGEAGWLLYGTSLKVYSYCDNQGRKWRLNRAQQVKQKIGQQLLEAGWIKEWDSDWRRIFVP
jgi:hypothetical protein